MQLVINPYQFDVMVMQNFYGDLVSAVGNGLAGGISVVGGASLGIDVAVFEAIHGDAPALVGTNTANPLPLLVAALLLLDHVGSRRSPPGSRPRSAPCSPRAVS